MNRECVPPWHRVARFASLTVVVAACGTGSDNAQRAMPGKGATSSQCTRSGAGEGADRALAACLTRDDQGVYEGKGSLPAPVSVFVDRSASMQGFLDPAYPAHLPTDYRSVIDKVLVGLHPAAAHSFGSGIREIQATLGTLGQKTFYTDADTRLEDVLAYVSRDATLAHSYVIVTDGRRGSPNAALGQYVALRAAAEQWIARGGSLIVAASMAPFSTVASDPSGCRRGSESAQDQRCPLYAFAFGAPGAQRSLVGSFGEAFEQLYTWPAVRLRGDELDPVAITPQTVLRFEPNWPATAKGTLVVRSRGDAPTTKWSTLKLNIRDTTSVEGAGLLAALRGDQLRMVIHTRRFGDGPVGAWTLLTGNASIVRPTPADPLAIDVVTRGSANGGDPTLYRIDLLSDGYPSWMDRFDASNAADRVRTFGLDRLFEAFKHDARGISADSATIVRLYLVAS
jgi:hypothetical protein